MRHPTIAGSWGCGCRVSPRVGRSTSGWGSANSCRGPGPDATPFEKVYLVLEVEMTVIAGRREVVLGLMDSCALAPGEMCEMCEIVNRGNNVAKMVVVMPYPEVPA